MYGALWRILPGPWPVKAIIALALLAGVAYALIWHVYPWIMQTFLPTPDATVA
ncbi:MULTISPECIES: hypothetical protein [unclassified Agrococcus]|uniref:hypothetical protein n=1 Tax=unclassified Agrococcus TaxID=2615065 RepID=UPI00360C34B9